MKKPKLWNRILSCGHERETSIAFEMEDYAKPKVGELCYCRECWKDVKIIGVKPASKKQLKENMEEIKRRWEEGYERIKREAKK